MHSNDITDVIFDFDYTITANHTHHFLRLFKEGHPKLITSPQIAGEDQIQTWTPQEIDTLWQYIMAETNPNKTRVPLKQLTGSPEQWRAIFETLIDNGKKVSIASFTSYGPIVKKFLSDIIGLNQKYLEQIHLETWLPTREKMGDKNRHLDRILGVSGDHDRSEKYSHALFFEDTEENVDAMNAVLGIQNNHVGNAIKVPSGSEKNATFIAKTLNTRLGISIPIIDSNF